MIKKIFFIILFNIILTLSTIAQYGNFSIRVIKVFPSKEVVYENSYNLLDELDKAKAAVIKKYSGNLENFVIEMITPNGKKTEELQNVRWIMTENNSKSYYKYKPSYKKSYPQKTKVVLFECYCDGSKKDFYESLNYDCSYKLFVNKKEQNYDDNYYTQEYGDKHAKVMLDQMSDDNSLYEIIRANDNQVMATNEASYKNSVCKNELKMYNLAKKDPDSQFIKFVNDEFDNILCESVKDSIQNEIDKRYTNKLKLADTASYENKINYYEQAKVLKPSEEANLNKNIENIKKYCEEQQKNNSKEKKGLFKKKKDKKQDKKKDKKEKKQNKKKNKKSNRESTDNA